MKKIFKALGVGVIFSLALGLVGLSTTSAATAPDLGSTASGFAVLAGAAISDTAVASVITGNVGLSPTGGTAITQLSCTDVTGTIYDTNGGYTGGYDSNTACLMTDATLLTAAKADVSLAFNDAKTQAQNFSVTASLTDSFAGIGYTLSPGVYNSGSTMGVPISLTLDGGGDPNAVFIFQAGSTLNTVSGSTITLTNGAKASNVFWQVGSSATLGTGSTFRGTIMAAVSITDDGGSTVYGRLLADADNTDADSTGTVSLNNTTVTAPSTLRVIKTVVNDDGGTAVASDFTINVSGTNVSPSTFAGSAVGVDVSLDPGAYAVTEVSLPGYLQTGSGDCSGTILAGETKTCTITNDDIAPQLIVNKVVINDNGGTKVISDFPLFVDGASVTSGVATTTTTGLHTVSETAYSGYATTIGGDCNADGTITLALGDVKTCIITNDDIAPPPSGGGAVIPYYAPVPPHIALTKVPSPLNLPNGPGTVKYTYTLRNIGTVPVTDITMVGDTCSPINLISGDANNDDKLDVDETWVYTCSTTLSKTHTNIVTAIGWANGISVTDTANATVIVGIPVVPPLIHVTKVPSPSVLPAGGGMVTYTNKVTNPGTVALSNVRLTDDKCGPVKYVSGDTNSNSKLESTETWTYTCSAELTKTTVNTVTASGEANGLIARDSAIVTVVVPPAVAVSATPTAVVPALPNTGGASQNGSIPWHIVMLAGFVIVVSSSSLVLAVRRHTN